MNTKRIKCILTGGCRFRDSAISECDDKEKTCTQVWEEVYSRSYLQTIRDSRLR